MGRTSYETKPFSSVAGKGWVARALTCAFVAGALVLAVGVLTGCSDVGSPFGLEGLAEEPSRVSAESWELVRDIWADLEVPTSDSESREWRRSFKATYCYDPYRDENDTMNKQEDCYDDQGRVVQRRSYNGEILQSVRSWEYGQDATTCAFELYDVDGTVKDRSVTTTWTREDGTMVEEQTDASGELVMRRETGARQDASGSVRTDTRWSPLDDQKSSVSYSVYDTDGKLLLSQFYQGGTSEQEALLYWSKSYDYDTQGREVEASCSVGASPYSLPWNEYVEYASDGGKVTMRLENPAGASYADKIYVVAYDEEGRPYYVSVFYAGSADAAGDPTEDFITYNEDGNPVEIVRQSYGVTIERRTFTYDEDANLLYSVETKLDDDGQLQRVVYDVYQYQTIDGSRTTELADITALPRPQIDDATRYEPLNQSIVMARELHYPEDGVGWWESVENEEGVSVGADFTSMIGAEPAVRIFVRREGAIVSTSYASYAKRPDGELVVVGRDGARMRIRSNEDGSLAIVGTLGDGTVVDVNAVRHSGLMN